MLKWLLKHYKFSADPSPDLCSVSMLSVCVVLCRIGFINTWGLCTNGPLTEAVCVCRGGGDGGCRFDLHASLNQHQARVHAGVAEVIWSSHSKTERCMTALDRYSLNVTKSSGSTGWGGQI